MQAHLKYSIIVKKKVETTALLWFFKFPDSLYCKYSMPIFIFTFVDTENSRNCDRGGFLVLQLHDELMYEVHKSDLDIVKNIVKSVMERTTELSVILPVNIKVGPSWGSMKEVL